MKNVGIFTHNYPKTSRERKNAGIFIYDFAQRLDMKCNVYVFCNDEKGRKEKYKKVPVFWYKWAKNPKNLGNWNLFSPLSLFNFARLVFVGCRESIWFSKKNKLDYCLATWALPSAVFTYFIKKRLGIHYSVWCLGSDINIYARIPILKQIIIKCLREADVIYANSYLLVKKVTKLTKRQTVFLPTVTEIGSFKKVPTKVDKKILNFLFVGRLEKVKGPGLLAKSVKELEFSEKNFCTHLLGKGSMYKELKNLINKYSLEKSFILHGWSNKDKVLSYMKDSDFLVLPSRSESFPLVMVEAAKMGLPIIATDVGDCAKLIKKYKIGFLIKEKTATSISNTMKNIIRKGEKIKNKFNSGLKKFSRDFNLERSVIRFLRDINVTK